MPRSISKRLAAWCALALCLLALGSGCLGTPLPDPPSFSGESITLSEGEQPGTVRLVGDRGAVRDGGTALRVTIPPRPGVLVATNADGSFGRIVSGAAGERIFFELILADEDLFVGAFAADVGARLHAVDPGPDGDMDGSPDAIDCAPSDASVGGQRCVPVPCASDADCGPAQVCTAGVCGVAPAPCRVDGDCAAGETCGPAMLCIAGAACVPAPETCNGVDDDCNALVDEGDPGGGVPCTTPCAGVFMCSPTGSLDCVCP